jgi:hypothetical protein
MREKVRIAADEKSQADICPSSRSERQPSLVSKVSVTRTGQ